MKQILKEIVEFKCEHCGLTFKENELEIHRMKRGVDGGEYLPRNIRVLCKECHDLYDYDN